MVSKERIKTNILLINSLNYGDELSVKSLDDDETREFYDSIVDNIDQQLEATVEWLSSDDAREYFFEEGRYQEEIFEKLDSQWERILNGTYENIDELLNEIYEYGKIQGYEDISEKLRFTEADKLALTHIRNYNYNLIRNLDGELRHSIKNQIFQGLIKGEHPNSLAPRIRDLGLKTLPNSTLSPLQRATMIARTETARAQNTGILQSYVNEGFTEVKILTAEDDNVCYLCLRNAYEFDEDNEIIYSNKGEERVHNIQELITKKNWVPLHPNCRCTYVCVTGSRGKPPENPYVVNLTNENAHNWAYIHEGTKYSLQGNTPLGRVDFEENWGG